MLIRELLLFPLWVWVDWLESVAKSSPPEVPLTKAMSIAGPYGWNPPPVEVGLPSGPRIFVPVWLNTRMSGVNGLLMSNTPPGHSVSSLQTLGMPCPDSRTNTWKLLDLPRKAMPVGIFRPATNTEAVNPGGITIPGGNVGLKFAVLAMHCGEIEGLLTTLFAAVAIFGNASSGAKLHATPREHKCLGFKMILLPFPLLKTRGAIVFYCEI